MSLHIIASVSDIETVSGVRLFLKSLHKMTENANDTVTVHLFCNLTAPEYKEHDRLKIYPILKAYHGMKPAHVHLLRLERFLLMPFTDDDTVMLIDGRDSVFQQPFFPAFDKLSSDNIYMMTEVPRNTYGSRCVKGWYRQAFGKEPPDLKALILNGGFIYGKYSRLKTFIQAAVNFVDEKYRNVFGIDQTAIAEYNWTHPGAITVLKAEDGICLHLVGASVKYSDFSTDTKDIYSPVFIKDVSDAAIKPVIVHQYDRHPTLKTYFEKIYK